MSKPILWIVIPCYNEEAVLPITAPLFLEKINSRAWSATRAGCCSSTTAPRTRPGS